MRIARYRRENGSPGLARVFHRDGELRLADLQAFDSRFPDTMGAFLECDSALRRAMHERSEPLDIDRLRRFDEAVLLPPVDRTARILCIGLNYRDHAAEVGLPLPDFPTVLVKLPHTLIGHRGAIEIPTISEEVDYEAELAVVIGKHVEGISEFEALSAVVGYSIFNDVSVRDFQMRTSQWTLGKNFKTHGPLGPYMVTTEEIALPNALHISLSVDGELLQDSNTGEMVFGVAQLVSTLSSVMPLWPGDVIATGTPAGVGASRKPKRFLKAGETVRIAIAGIGMLENAVVAAC